MVVHPWLRGMCMRVAVWCLGCVLEGLLYMFARVSFGLKTHME